MPGAHTNTHRMYVNENVLKHKHTYPHTHTYIVGLLIDTH